MVTLMVNVQVRWRGGNRRCKRTRYRGVARRSAAVPTDGLAGLAKLTAIRRALLQVVGKTIPSTAQN